MVVVVVVGVFRAVYKPGVSDTIFSYIFFGFFGLGWIGLRVCLSLHVVCLCLSMGRHGAVYYVELRVHVRSCGFGFYLVSPGDPGFG